MNPSVFPTMNPTDVPSFYPTASPSLSPSLAPTASPTIPSRFPTESPSTIPTTKPTNDPTIYPSLDPSIHPTIHPSSRPTTQPSPSPTYFETTEMIVNNHTTGDPQEGVTLDAAVDTTITPTYKVETTSFIAAKSGVNYQITEVSADDGELFISYNNMVMIAAGITIGICCAIIISAVYYRTKRKGQRVSCLRIKALMKNGG